MAFCTNCGTEVNGAAFCTNCGAPMPETTETPDMPASAPVKKSPKGLGKIIAILAVLGIVLAGVFLLMPRSYEAVVKDYVKASYRGDAKKLASLIPDFVVEYVVEERYDGDKEEWLEYLEESRGEVLERLEDEGADLKNISYKITEEEALTEENLEIFADFYEVSDLEIKEGKDITVEVTIHTDDDDIIHTLWLQVVKIGRSWYLKTW